MTDENTLPVDPVDTAAPDVPAVEAPPADSAPVDVETPDDAGQPVVEDKVPDSVQKRIDKAIGKMREMERRAAAQEARNDELVDLLVTKGVIQPPDQPPPVAEIKRPTLAQFEYDEAKYEAALDQYFEAKAEAVAERKLVEFQGRAQESRVQQSYEQRAKVFAESIPDFAELTNDRTLPISAPMAQIIRKSEVGPALFYELARNRELSAQIAQLPALEATYELGKIEARISRPSQAPAPKPAVSKAPPPPPSIEATEPAVEKDPSKMTDAEFARWRKRQIAQRR